MAQALGSLRALSAPCREHCNSAREWKSCFAGHVWFWVSRFGCTVYSIPLNLNPLNLKPETLSIPKDPVETGCSLGGPPCESTCRAATQELQRSF